VPILDPSVGVLAIGVVYDGPAEAGKTTSLRALSRSLRRSLLTPEEARGRTVFFDWMEYVGGRFDGHEIRCQIMSVPGQEVWAERRERLLDLADVVVCVGDTSAAGWPDSLAWLRRLRAQLEKRPTPPVGIVFQANKRDLPDAVPLDEMRAQLGQPGWGIAIVESVAPDGSGIREAFVLGVRLAVDRVRELQKEGRLAMGQPRFHDADELLEHVRGKAAREPELPLASALASVAERVGESAPRAGDPPRSPGAHAPSGLIWPPVEGRLILHEAANEDLRPFRAGHGDWFAGMGRGWRFRSAADAVYRDVDEGQAALLVWARQHAACLTLLSSRRCVVLAETGDGRWRLWQVVRTQRSLRETLPRHLTGVSPERALERLAEAARLVLEVDAQSRELGVPLRCTLDTVGKTDGTAPVYVGFMAAPGDAEVPAGATPDELGSELAVLARSAAGNVAGAGAWLTAISAAAESFRFTGGETVLRSVGGALVP